MRRNRFLIALWALFLLLCGLPAAYGQSIWKGGPGNWSNQNNWCDGHVPPTGANISIGACGSPPSAVSQDISATIDNLSIDNGNSLTILQSNLLNINGGISNAGTLAMAGTSSSGAQMRLTATTVTLGGGSTFFMNDAPNEVLGGGTDVTLINQGTITGAGYLGVEGLFNLNNHGTVNAVGTHPLQISTNFDSLLNSGILEATSGGTLQFVLNGGATGLTLNNAGGTIEALDRSTVQLQLGNVTGGTLTTAGSGLIQGHFGGLSNLTNSGVFQVGGISGVGTGEIRLSGSINNTGTLRLGSSVWGDDFTVVDGTVNLSGGGHLLFANSIESIVPGNGTPILNNNDNTVNGTGLIAAGLTLNNNGIVDANQSTSLRVLATTNNTGTMQASGGGDLSLEGGVDNTGGIIQALDASTVTLVSPLTYKGGTFATAGSGVIQITDNLPIIDSVKNTGTLLAPNNSQMELQGTITNSGTISVDATAGPVGVYFNRVTLRGKGLIRLSNSANNGFSGAGGSPALSNVDNLIEGAGTFNASVTNQKKGTFLANVSMPLLFGNTVTNLGKFQVNPGSALRLQGNGNFTNFSAHTLTGGTYLVGGTFAFANAKIVTNAATIELTSPTAQIVDFNTNINALTSLASNTMMGSLTISGNAGLVTTPSFSNAGIAIVAAKSKFAVGGIYTQTMGTTKVDGTLTAPTGFSLQGGTLFGKGTIAATVTSGASVTAGDTVTGSGKLSITGAYTQQVAGSLNIQVGGTAVGNKYSQLAVSNGVSLDGTLNVTLIKNFVPAIGDTFTIVTFSTRSGQFATVNGLSINSGEHFQVNYTSTGVQLQVVSGP
jgi:hypothetical protein